MSDFTPEMQKKTAEHLDRTNAELKKAMDALDRDDYEGAIQAAANAMDAKHDSITCLPDIGQAPGKVLPFFPVYDLLEDIDFLAQRALNWKSTAKTLPKPLTLEELRARVKNAIDELEKNILKKKPAFADPWITELLSRLREKLKKIHEALRAAEAGGDPDPAHFLGVSELKKEILTAMGGPLDLWFVYSCLSAMDNNLLFLIDHIRWLEHWKIHGNEKTVTVPAAHDSAKSVEFWKKLLEWYLLGRPKPAMPGGGTWPEPPAPGPTWPQPIPGEDDLPHHPDHA